MITLRLSAGQQSALECAGIVEGISDEYPVLDRVWDRRGALRFEPCDLDALLSEITEAANDEDDHAERRAKEDPESAKYARRARRSLETLSARIIRMLKQRSTGA